MDNSVSYSGFAPVNYNGVNIGVGDENINNYQNITSIIDEINNNISVKYTQKDEKNKFFEIKNFLLKYLKNDIEELNLIIKDDGTSEIESVKKNDNDEYIGKNLIEEFDNFMKYFKLKSDKLYSIENKLKTEIEKNKQDIKQIDSLIEYYDTLKNKYDDTDETIKSMETLAENIKKNSKIDSTKEEYVLRKKEMMQYLDVIKYLNKCNLGNTCSLCLTNNVNVYYNPCGHTLCDGCHQKIVDNKQNDNISCVYCRKSVYDVRKLYYI